MKKEWKVLLIGESWFVHTLESKGFDCFTFDRYETGIQYIQPALEKHGFQFIHMPSHRVEYDFPDSAQKLRELCDVVLLSDIGANTFLLSMKTFLSEESVPNKLEILKDFVGLGGGLAMIGGYLTFMGIEGKGKYKDTVIEEILPVTLEPVDDRREMPQGFAPQVVKPDHPILQGVPAPWPNLLGYNKITAKPDAEVLAVYGEDTFLALSQRGRGRTLAFAGDCAPHWMPRSFCTWQGYDILWSNIVRWLAGEI